ncbi:MAG: hypothetical protein DYG92_06450 [Leptolyngbya sp. PLA1]|nr:hypothetical protein [Leptolyngbya sp. PLA1]
MSDREAILNQTRAARSQAEQLLGTLLESQEAILQGGRPDLFRRVVGASSVEQAIATTRRLIETYDRILAEAEGRPCNPVAEVRVPSRSAGPWTVAATYAASRTA